MGADGLLDCHQEPLGLAQDERLGELVARAELLVEGLAADAGGAGDVGHRDVRPTPALEFVARGVEQGVAQQFARGERVWDAIACGGSHGARAKPSDTSAASDHIAIGAVPPLGRRPGG